MFYSGRCTWRDGRYEASLQSTRIRSRNSVITDVLQPRHRDLPVERERGGLISLTGICWFENWYVQNKERSVTNKPSRYLETTRSSMENCTWLLSIYLTKIKWYEWDELEYGISKFRYPRLKSGDWCPCVLGSKSPFVLEASNIGHPSWWEN